MSDRSFLRWVLVLDVDADLVADGLSFPRGGQQIANALARAYPLARSSGIRVQVIHAPELDDVASMQGPDGAPTQADLEPCDACDECDAPIKGRPPRAVGSEALAFCSRACTTLHFARVCEASEPTLPPASAEETPQRIGAIAVCSKCDRATLAHPSGLCLSCWIAKDRAARSNNPDAWRAAVREELAAYAERSRRATLPDPAEAHARTVEPLCFYCSEPAPEGVGIRVILEPGKVAHARCMP